ncbi:MAG: hypothetical protein P1R58_13015 [bacterium]|nr:hypothetical protein [bacterium]
MAAEAESVFLIRAHEGVFEAGIEAMAGLAFDPVVKETNLTILPCF